MDAMSFSIPEFLNDQRSLAIFLFVTVGLGGLAASLAGRAIAATWRPWWHVVAFMLLLAIGVRFIHFSVYGSSFLSLHYYLVDAAACLAFGLLNFRAKRVDQMVTCYRWINSGSGPLRWRRRAQDVARAVDSG
jgi:hypothetical protein